MIVKLRINRIPGLEPLINWFIGEYFTTLSSFLRASEVLRPPHMPQILVVFKLPTTKINFVDLRQIQAAFWETNYTTFSYLLIPIYVEDTSEIQFLIVAASCSIFTDTHS